MLVISTFSILQRWSTDPRSTDHAVYYYMVTALPGCSMSKLFYVAMSIVITIHIVNPFYRLNSKAIWASLCGLVALVTALHISDATFSDIHDRSDGEVDNPYFAMIVLAFDIPGFLTYSLNTQPTRITTLTTGWGTDVCSLTFYLTCPSIVAVCMIVQIAYLLRSQPMTTDQLLARRRHAVGTIMCVSGLYIVCHVTYIIVVEIWSDLHNLESLGLSEFTLPTVHSLLFPVILIARKPELRQRYRRVFNYFRRERPGVDNELSN